MKDQKQDNSFYITTPIFYPNGKLHIGNAYTTIVCDVLARMARLDGRPTYFLTGVDENSLKVEKAAKEFGMDVMTYLDTQTYAFKDLFEDLHISYDQYIRTTDEVRHHGGVNAIWNRMKDAGDIYPSTYEGYYCVGCEGFKTEKDLVQGMCPIHETPADHIKEQNYFFKLSKYGSLLKEKIESGELAIFPTARRNEVLAHIHEGLDDISFSRPYKGQPNAILVPGDDSQSVYVWGDALTNYISALGFGSADDGLYKKFWPANTHMVGKDILRFHAEIWPAMLLSAQLPLPKTIFAHGLLLSGGKKMGKSTGNAVDPKDIIKTLGAEALRFFFAYDVPLADDGEVTTDLIHASYNAHLANGIGNLTNRLLKMIISYDVSFDPKNACLGPDCDALFDILKKSIDTLDINGYAAYIWEQFASIDKEIQDTEPFKMFKEKPEEAKAIVKKLSEKFYTLVQFAEPILPKTSPKILIQFNNRQMPETPLFSRV